MEEIPRYNPSEHTHRLVLKECVYPSHIAGKNDQQYNITAYFWTQEKLRKILEQSKEKDEHNTFDTSFAPYGIAAVTKQEVINILKCMERDRNPTTITEKLMVRPSTTYMPDVFL